LLFQVGAWLTLVVELGAPLALLGRRWAYAWVGLAWCFHLAILGVMAVLFPYPLSGVAFASMLPVERLAAWRPRRRSVGAVAEGEELVGSSGRRHRART
jgi:hypothetical protein